MSLPRLNSIESEMYRRTTLRRSSIASSLATIYEQYNVHLSIIKWVGVFVMVALISTSFAFTSELKKKEFTNCMKMLTTESTPDLNGTLCDYIKQCALPSDYYVTVCSYQGLVKLDVRKFIGRKVTVKGIAMNTNQWNYLQRLVPRINSAMTDARP